MPRSVISPDRTRSRSRSIRRSISSEMQSGPALLISPGNRDIDIPAIGNYTRENFKGASNSISRCASGEWTWLIRAGRKRIERKTYFVFDYGTGQFKMNTSDTKQQAGLRDPPGGQKEISYGLDKIRNAGAGQQLVLILPWTRDEGHAAGRRQALRVRFPLHLPDVLAAVRSVRDERKEPQQRHL